jgi:hypothetical protein
MIDTDEIYGQIETAAAEVEAATTALARAQTNRDNAVRAALAAGATIGDLTGPANITKWRLYQIRDHRR